MKLKTNDIKSFNKLKNIIVNYVHIDYFPELKNLKINVH